ncbi:MAG: hypothetical protein GY862_32120 [Gammaproteobacteria bacterium]|nr:hypothetical protein [Gammaproteobacteria bacterium]
MGFEPGGLADKLGNRYEGRWVAKQLLRLLNEEIRTLTVEPVGDDERGVDLWIETKNGIREAHQCKARNRSEESWSISDLKNRGILQYLKFQLDRDKRHEFRLVSAVGAILFGDLCESAANGNQNPETFYTYQIQAVGENRRKAFRKFCEALGLDKNNPNDRAKAFDYLRRTRVIHYADDQNTWQDLLATADYRLTGKPETVIAVLLTYAENNDQYRKPIHADELRGCLAGQNIHPKNLEHNSRIAPAVEELQRQFVESIPITDGFIEREETALLIDALKDDKDVILHGAAGYGKSGVLYALAKHLQRENIPCLPIRLDRREPKNTAALFGQSMGLPDCPAYSLAALAVSCVLILDQLDAIRWTRAHSGHALDVCKELLRRVRALRGNGKKITAVLCCRDFDLEHDPELKNWLSDSSREKFTKIEVKALSRDVVEKTVGTAFANMSEKQKKILACIQNLSIWKTLRRSSDTPNFDSAIGLMRIFWKNRYQALEKAGVPPNQVDNVINILLDYMEPRQKLSAPQWIVENEPTITEALHSFGLLQTSAGWISFCHQSYSDYRIAHRLLQRIEEGGGDISAWLGSREKQSLFRREQLRQALSMLAEESPRAWLQASQALLQTRDVRFHIKHLVLALMGQQKAISRSLGEYCQKLLEKERWREHVLETVCSGHPAYVSYLLVQGVIARWLNSGEEKTVSRALWLLRSVAEKIPDEVTSILEPYAEQGGDWPVKVLDALCQSEKDDSEAMFQLRLKLTRLGFFREYLFWEKLAEKHPLRTIQLLEAIISSWKTGRGNTSNGQKKRIERWYDKEYEALNKVAAGHPRETWDCLMPQIERLTVVQMDPYGIHLERWRKNTPQDREKDIARGLVELVIMAGRTLAVQQADELLTRTVPLENCPSHIVQEMLFDIYAALPETHADAGIRWLLAYRCRFHPGDGDEEPKWQPAADLITRLSPHCSSELFWQLETAICQYHAEHEKQQAERYLTGWRDGYFGDYWGRSQYFLLPALDGRRRDPKTNELIAVLQRKFADYPAERFCMKVRMSGGQFGSKLTPSLDCISDRAWLDIVSNKKISGDRRGKWIQVDAEHALESSVRQFSDSLACIAKRFPERFGQLALRFPDDAAPDYISAILGGLKLKKPDNQLPNIEKAAWQPARAETVEAFLDKYQSGDDREIAVSFCRLLTERAEEKWPDKIIDRLLRYAKERPDLEPGKLNIHRDKAAEEVSVSILLDNAFDCVRMAARAIGALLREQSDRLERLKTGMASLAADPHPAVRMAAIETLLPLLDHDKDLAVQWFCIACDNDLRIAASPRATEFFNYTVNSHSSSLGPIIKRMINSATEEVVTNGAKAVTGYWLFYGLFEPELRLCRQGSSAQRKGVAHIAAHFMTDRRYAARCRDLIRSLLNDPDKEVRGEISRGLHKKELFDTPENKDFLMEYTRSEAFADDPKMFIYSLEDMKGSLLPLSEVIFSICGAFSTKLQVRSQNISSGISYAASQISSILLRLYEQAQAEEESAITMHCLDMWDDFFENRVGMTRDLMREIDDRDFSNQ